MATATRAVLRVVDGRETDSRAARYVARIRWTFAADPDWEIDTRHVGFESWRQAACFANGLMEEGASALFLQDGVLVLELVNGRDGVVDGHETVIWQRMNPRSAVVPDDLSFVRATVGPGELSAMGLDGALRPMRFGVDDLRGSSRLDVRVEADVGQRAVVMTLVLPTEDEEMEMTPFGRQLVDLPQA
jgi:hypothetical protein